MDSGEFSNETADYERKITRAVIEGDVEKLRELCNTLPRDFNVNFIIKCLNTTVLMNAVMMNDYLSAEILCKHGADVNLGTYDSYKAIHWVCEKQNNPQMLKLLINHGANIDENWLYGERAIHLALKHSRTENVEVLLDAGADISGCIRLDNERYSNISTLCLAALKCPNLVPKFLKQGADPNDDLSTCGSSVLGLMLENNGDKETVKAVIQAGACISNGCRGKTAIECCKNLGQIFAFLESGVPVSEIESQLKDSLIAMAILEDFCEATVYENILKLISFGAIPNGTETFKDSALILSIKKHFWEIVDILIAQGADLNHKGEGGNTALHVCCQNVAFLDNYKVMITQLCTAGADVNVMNDDRLTPLLILMMQMSPAEFPTSNDRHEDKSLISCLLNYGANVNVVLPTTSESTLHFACMQGDFETAKMLIKAGYDVNKCETNGEAPIFAFFPLDSARETSVVNMLLENGASANVLDKGGTSLLERVFKQLKSTYSSFRDEMEPREDLIEKLTSILLQLLLNEADPNLATPGQDSVLIQAIQTPGMDDVASALVEAGADVCHIGRNKMTTFEACCLNDEIENLGENQLRILSLIIEANFPLNEPLSDGRYPLQLVMDYTNTDAIIQDMLSKGADPNKYKEGGEPPLVLSLYRNPSVTYALIEAGADTSVKSNEGISVIKLFCEKVFYDEQYCCLPNSQSTRLIIDHFEFAKSKVELEQRTNLAEDTTKRTPMETTSGEMKPFSGKEKILTKKRSQKLSEQQRKCESNICCEIIKILIEKNNENVNIKTPCGLAPLCVAVKLGSHSLIDYLLEKKADPNCMKLMNESLLFFALIRGNEDIIKGLIKAGANVNHCTVLPGTGEKQSLLNRFLDENGEFSKASNLVNLVQILIENGASVNECEEGFASPLIKAVRLSSFELVDLLLRQGANVNHHGKNGFTALHECCIKGKFEVEDPNTEIFNLLLGAGASVNSQASSVNTPVTTCKLFSMILGSTTLKRKKKGEILELLLKSVTDINVLNHEGYTPLNLMIKEKTNLNVEDVQDLLMQKAGPNICLKGCNSPLINSLLRCKLDVASYLLKAGGDVKHEGKSGLTALHAVLNLELTSGYITGRIEMIQKLLAAGSDVNKRELEGNTGLMFCLKSSCKRRKDEVLPVIEFLLEAGADPNISDISGGRPLEIIIKSLSKSRNETKIQELVEMMFLYGAKCNEYEKGQDSVLHMAVSNGLQGVVQILVNRGADVNHRGKHQQIPLHRYFSSGI
ncbi:poly [ADP-ribose] polymerase tankyrase-like [Saccostrea cucullata]|uniref:poly [ADP-ribose] polymerase tankyrase-like n=1 Tax=Saccostrea cuccullata TaxID=36930 RepID=UPI002ED1D2A8